jgi:hypothetical protein
VPNYLVESYLSRPSSRDLRQLAARARTAAEALSRAGKDVTYLRSSFLPGDELCLHWFTAASPADVGEAAQLAELVPDRIVEAIEGADTDAKGGGSR